jgi:hypothetical protein
MGGKEKSGRQSKQHSPVFFLLSLVPAMTSATPGRAKAKKARRLSYDERAKVRRREREKGGDQARHMRRPPAAAAIHAAPPPPRGQQAAVGRVRRVVIQRAARRGEVR